MRFEIVTTDAGYHARIKGENHETVWTTEVYTRKRTAEEAVRFLAAAAGLTPIHGPEPDEIIGFSSIGAYTADSASLEYVDERTSGNS